MSKDYLATQLRNARYLALVLVLLWAQVANANHLVEHVFTGEPESELCELGHSPVIGLNSGTALFQPFFTDNHQQNFYLTPFVKPGCYCQASIRAPPSSLF